MMTNHRKKYWKLKAEAEAIETKIREQAPKAFVKGSMVRFQRGRMITPAVAQVMMVSWNGEKLYICNTFTEKTLWIDVSCVCNQD